VKIKKSPPKMLNVHTLTISKRWIKCVKCGTIVRGKAFPVCCIFQTENFGNHTEKRQVFKSLLTSIGIERGGKI
jgi:hypothetical protein